MFVATASPNQHLRTALNPFLGASLGLLNTKTENIRTLKLRLDSLIVTFSIRLEASVNAFS